MFITYMKNVGVLKNLIMYLKMLIKNLNFFEQLFEK